MSWVKPPPRVRQYTGDNPGLPRAQPVRISDGKDRACVPVKKASPVRDEAYRRAVAAMACAHCGRPGPSQAAHGDAGKGMGIKSSDESCFPACADSEGRRGCHALIGSSGLFTREQRRALETRYAEQTREILKDKA